MKIKEQLKEVQYQIYQKRLQNIDSEIKRLNKLTKRYKRFINKLGEL